ncbi:hypothetical protein A3I27_02315 [Candidatus Giovannonibacteria bacterium RIFCSPLOWO2_02_FULL_43_11b]|uniref:Uncharacterized protein n=1 Tax=Candidatus Giovannonibacteria bacterium RIFCSPHIGHO2_12_FULL_43_15 TaxID=1798341 RepID=A0A1F5WNJ5_9BACT|nr:MAG: hypothetical protein A2739_01290 [Candidatus Giovannonibacteria bacterium RIFCSPHIGHO2_01_FULL_43_100]OGF67530.1 MAG: hypothetical protein A3B97_00080 [Candidatus Giovannonibacteria bacterium RIFCSPHIGHO2_02_FULL_43_32]OGF77174.1 MAG: hypothetical protein A3F23_01350 [Candidatus Giovannonibacteria bacterium RIFCSPHIGHO2_12_FULL_43_15]OGF78915.1 MAG: hypothetical protein A3A15_03375 [Candidatus Giovannonibacteria bacterium RIFCSPLOWO2_01_FULL_43_60]OGF89016.1 MAG: hypothetical protein A3
MKFLPKILFLVLIVASGGYFWLLLSGTHPTFGLMSSLSAAVLVFFLGILGVSFILLEPNLTALSLFLSASPVLLFLENKYLALGIMLGLSILSFIPTRRIKKEIKSRITFSIREILHKGMPTFLTLMALSLAAFFYPIEGIRKFEDIIPESFFEKALTFLPFEVPSDALYRTSIDLLQERFRAYERYLPAVFAFAVFVAFRTLFIPLGWLGIAISWIAFKILLYAGVVKISTRPIPQEYIEFK